MTTDNAYETLLAHRLAAAIADLKKLPTLAVGQAADLKIDTGTTRVWISRCTIEDGETQPIQIERLRRDGRWIEYTPATQEEARKLALRYAVGVTP